MTLAIGSGGTAFLLSVILAVSTAAADTVTWTCHRNDRFTVLSTDKDDSAGDKFIVRRTTGAITPDCAIETRATDHVLGTGPGDAYYYISLTDRFLILDEGTSPDRGVVIYDLDSGKLLLSAPYSLAPGQSCSPTEGCQSDDFRVDKDGVTFWRATTEKATPRNCPGFSKMKSNGLPPTIEEKTLFRFATATLEGLKTRRCVARQSEYGGSYILNGITRHD